MTTPRIALVVLVVSQLSPATGYAWFGGMGTHSLRHVLTSAACAVFFWKNPEEGSVWRNIAFPAASTLLLGSANVIAVLNFDALTGDTGLASKMMLASVLVVFTIGVVLAVFIRGAKPVVYFRIGRQKLTRWPPSETTAGGAPPTVSRSTGEELERT